MYTPTMTKTEGTIQCPHRPMVCVISRCDTQPRPGRAPRGDAQREHSDGDGDVAVASGAEDGRVGGDVVGTVGDGEGRHPGEPRSHHTGSLRAGLVGADCDGQPVQAEPQRHEPQEPRAILGQRRQSACSEQGEPHEDCDARVPAGPDLPSLGPPVGARRDVEHRHHDHVVEVGTNEQRGRRGDGGGQPFHEHCTVSHGRARLDLSAVDFSSR